MKDEATHQPILYEVIQQTTGPIHLETPHHRFTLLSEELFKIHGHNWKVVLVDLSTWDQRMWAIEQLRYRADYIIIHDAQDKNLGRFFDYFREYRVSDFPFPTTLLGSNTYDLENINVEGATIINR